MEDALRAGLVGLLVEGLLRLNPCSNGRCSARRFATDYYISSGIVLILVLMEDALRAYDDMDYVTYDILVLILVLMEDALRAEIIPIGTPEFQSVLILVLMEDALRDW